MQPLPADPKHIERRNFILNIFEGGLFIASGGIVSVQTVLPALVVRLGGNDVAVGALSVIVYVGAFLPQFFAARIVETLPWKKPWSTTFGLFQRLALLVNGILIWALATEWPGIALAMFFLIFAFQQVMGGIATPGWFDFFAKLTPMKKRGRLIGLRISVGGIGAFFTGLLLTWLLLRFAFPTNYALALLIASLFQFLSLAVQFRLVEAEPSNVVELKPIFAFLRQLPVVLRGNHDFRRFLVSAAFLIPATMPVGFFTVYALQRFQASESMVGAFTLSMVAIQVVSALVTGLTADRHGHKVALLIAAAAMLLATLTALLAPAVEWFILVFVFVGINAGTEVMSRFNIAVEYGPPEQRSTYVGLMNTVLAPFYLSGLLAGAISQMFGYEVLFGVGILCSLIGSWFLYSRVRDPRVLHGTSHSPDAT